MAQSVAARHHAALVDRDRLRQLFDLTGRVAIVTGGTRGIGRSIAEGFVAAGAKVVVASRKPDACAETEAHLRSLGGEALGVPTHLGELAPLGPLVERTVERFGRLDIVVNNAATALTEPIGRFTPAAWDKVYEVNLRGPRVPGRAALPHLEKSPCASVVNVISAGRLPLRRQPVDVRGRQGRADVVHALDGGRPRAEGHPRERARAGHGRHRHGAQQPRPISR